MDNVDYSEYDDFVDIVEDLLPRIPDMLIKRYRRSIQEETYGTPRNPKTGLVFTYAGGADHQQVVTPLTILIECVCRLYYAMHELGPFPTRAILAQQMRIRTNLFVANKGWDALHILDYKIEGVPSLVQAAQRNETQATYPQAPLQASDAMSARSESPPVQSGAKAHRLYGREATPTPTPELTTLTNHHLKVLASINDRFKWDDGDLLDPKSVSVHAWRRRMHEMLSVVPFARDVLDRKTTTFADADSLLRSIVMRSFSPQLRTEYFSEHGDKPVQTAVDLFDWAMKKCTVHSESKQYELLTATLALRWDQIGGHAYDFLVKWEAHVSELHAYLEEPWTPTFRYKTLKRALPNDKNALFGSVFLRECYALAAENAPVSSSTASDDSGLIALRAATLINCWACGELGHAANRCPDDTALARWKRDKIKVPPKTRANTCIVLPREDNHVE